MTANTPTDQRITVEVGDITQLDVDAIVNAANQKMLGGGGVDGAIHRAAGPQLRQACENVPEVRPGVRCPTGEARLTPGFNLPADYVIHTVGPVYDGGGRGEADQLASCYHASLQLAAEHDVDRLAFPAISTGVYGYPIEAAARIAIDTTRQWLDAHDKPAAVVFCCFSEGDAAVYRSILDR